MISKRDQCQIHESSWSDGRKLSMRFSSAQLLSLFLLPKNVPKNSKKSICSICWFFFSSLLQNWGVKWGERTRESTDSGGRKEKSEWRCGSGCSRRERVHLSRTFLSLRLYFSPLPLNFQCAKKPWRFHCVFSMNYLKRTNGRAPYKSHLCFSCWMYRENPDSSLEKEFQSAFLSCRNSYFLLPFKNKNKKVYFFVNFCVKSSHAHLDTSLFNSGNKMFRRGRYTFFFFFLLWLL